MIYNFISFFKGRGLLSKYLLLVSYIAVLLVISAQKHDIVYSLMMIFIILFTVIDIFKTTNKK